MLRLRTTVALSSLALAIGLGGTQWLSERTADSALTPSSAALSDRVLPQHSYKAVSPRPLRGVADRAPIRRPRVGAVASAQRRPGAAPVAAPEPAELVPIQMPPEHATAYEKLRGHLDGRVLVHLSVDGQGLVTAAELVQSSGDTVLDAHALRSVRGWRFAVPPEYPAGLNADFPMQFSSHAEAVANAP